MRRREFLGVLAGATIATPLSARAQGEHVRRVGMLVAGSFDSPEARARRAAFQQELRKRGWDDGRNLKIDYRWGLGNVSNTHRQAAELVALAPDVIVATGTAALAHMLQVTRTVPVVFVNVGDPVGAGYIESLAQPGGNATGLLQFEYSLSGKWPELLKEIAAGVKRIAVLRDAAISSGIGQFAVIQAVAPSLGLEVRPINNVPDSAEIERSIAAFARLPNGGLIITASALTGVHREMIIRSAAKHKLPAVYPFRDFVAVGGLLAYGPNLVDQYGRAAEYVDRILKGAKPADLPVQAPDKYELSINRNTANVLGLTVPPTLLARADEVIE